MFKKILLIVLFICFYHYCLIAQTNTGKKEINGIDKYYIKGYGLVNIRNEKLESDLSSVNTNIVNEDYDTLLLNSAPFSELDLILGVSKYNSLLDIAVNFQLVEGEIRFRKAWVNINAKNYYLKFGEVYYYIDKLSSKQEPLRDKINPDIFNLDGGFEVLPPLEDNDNKPFEQFYLNKIQNRTPLLGGLFHCKYVELFGSRLPGYRYLYNVKVGYLQDQDFNEFLKNSWLYVYYNYLELWDNEKLAEPSVRNKLTGGAGKVKLLNNFNISLIYYNSQCSATNYFKDTKKDIAYDTGLSYMHNSIFAMLGYFYTGKDYISAPAQSSYAETSFNKRIQLYNFEYEYNYLDEPVDLALPFKEATPNRKGFTFEIDYNMKYGNLFGNYYTSKNVSKEIYTELFWTNYNDFMIIGDLKADSYEIGSDITLEKLIKLQIGYKKQLLESSNETNELHKLERNKNIQTFGLTFNLRSHLSLLYGYKNISTDIEQNNINVKFNGKYSNIINSYGILWKIFKSAYILGDYKMVNNNYSIKNNHNAKTKLCIYSVMIRYIF